MHMIAGLGNPGREYEGSKHNAGFTVIDELARRWGVNTWQTRMDAEVAIANVDGEQVLLVKPQTYMNDSGKSVGPLMRWYKIDEKDVYVVYDDMDLPFGDIRIREKGSSGGHNGIKSIISHIGEEFVRIKCGIGEKEKDAIEHVLGEFNQTEQKNLDEILENIDNCIIEMLTVQNLDRIMQKYNKKKEKLK